MAVDVQYLIEHPNDPYWEQTSYTKPPAFNKLGNIPYNDAAQKIYNHIKECFLGVNLYINIPRHLKLDREIDTTTNLRQHIYFTSNVPDREGKRHVFIYACKHDTLRQVFDNMEEVIKMCNYDNQYKLRIHAKNNVIENCMTFITLLDCFLIPLKMWVNEN